MRVYRLCFSVLLGALLSAGCQQPDITPNAGEERAPQQESTSFVPGTITPSGESRSAGTPSAGALAKAEGNASRAASTQETFSVTLSESDEVPPVETDAHGKVEFAVENGGDQLHFDVTVHGVYPMMAARSCSNK